MGRKAKRPFAVCLLLSGLFYTFAVEEKPRCLSEISHVTALVGRTAFLPCLVQSNPLPTYEWRKVEDQALLHLGSRFIPSRKGLVIQNIMKEDGGKYQVKLENKITNQHSAVTFHLKVLDGSFVAGRQVKNISVNSSVSLSCGKRPNHTHTTIRWVDSTGSDVTNSERYTIHIDGSLIISPAKRTDSGEYMCKNVTKSNDGSLETSLKWYLNIQYGPQVITIEPFVSLVQNRTVLLPCISIGNPTPTTQWIFPNGTTVQDNHKFKTFGNGSLLIYNVSKRDALNYSCLSSNGIHPVQHGYTYLHVLFPPTFSSYPETNIIVSKGDDAVLNCTSSGIPKPMTSWRHANGSIDVGISNSDDTLVIKNTRKANAGFYICIVRSTAGELNRTFALRVKGKPSIPNDFVVKVFDGHVFITWLHQQDGGLKTNFELWYRRKSQTDFEWKIVSTINNFLNISMKSIMEESNVSKDVSGKYSVLYCSVRATNSEGFSEFSHVIQIFPSVKNSRVLSMKNLSDLPLKVYNLTVNISTNGYYTLKWKYIYTPGRPRAQTFLVQYLQINNTNIWKSVPQNGRVRRSVSTTDGESREKTIVFMGDTQPLKFRIYSVTASNRKSKPTVISVQDAPTFIGSVTPKKRETDIIPPLILGVIFIFFFLILIISLYCFCRRKKRKSQGRDNCNLSSFKDKSDLILDTCSMEFDDESKLFAPKIEMDSPALFHVAMCPALKLGKCSKRNDAGEKPTDKRHSDEVYFLLEPHPKEKATCTCNQGNQTTNTKEAKGYNKVKYKTSTPTGSLSSARSSVVVPSDGFDVEDYISDIDKGCVTELDKVRTQVLKRYKFKDSYDQFCRPDGNDFPLKVCARVDLSVLEKTEVDKNMDVNGIDDSTSENSAPESERRMKLKADDYNCNTKIFDMKNISKFEECNSSSSDPDSISFLKSDKSTIGIPENSIHYDYTLPKRDLASKRDIGYCSDNTSRISPLFVISHTYHPSQRANISGRPANYFSEDDTLTRVSPSTEYRVKQPPTYNQAIIDIERMSDRNDVTDSEEMYDKLLRMEKQLGVQLSDSLDSDLNTRTLPSNYRQQHSKNSSDTGYISDIPGGSARDRYTYREKSVRCAQLLSEFKSSKPDNLQLMGETTGSPNDTSNSMIGEMAEIPEVAPILKRSSSSTSNGTHNEWLV